MINWIGLVLLVLECCWFLMIYVKEILIMIILKLSYVLFFGLEVLLLGNIFFVNIGNNKIDGYLEYINGIVVIIEYNFFLM